MLIHSESEMLKYGQKLGRELKAPIVLELLGDVGVGKTTLTRGIALGLGINENIASPTFTVSKEYSGKNCRLVHYDFYRLSDPGIMSEDLAETISDPDTVTIIEWGQSIQDILPAKHKTIEIKYIDEDTREITEKWSFT